MIRGRRVAVALALALAGCSEHEEPRCDQTEEACAQEDEYRCNGDGIERCQPDADACLFWTFVEDCAPDRACIGSACEDYPDDECEYGATRCDGTSIERCVRDEQDWVTYWDIDGGCDDPLGTCDDSSGEAVCGPGPCPGLGEGGCDDLGGTRCEGAFLQRCLSDEEGCSVWTNQTDCAESGALCDDSGETAQCIQT